ENGSRDGSLLSRWRWNRPGRLLCLSAAALLQFVRPLPIGLDPFSPVALNLLTRLDELSLTLCRLPIRTEKHTRSSQWSSSRQTMSSHTVLSTAKVRYFRIAWA